MTIKSDKSNKASKCQVNEVYTFQLNDDWVVNYI